MKPVCLVMGAGAGIGGTVGKKFASEGYHAVLCRRSDEAGLETLVSDIKAAGGEATGFCSTLWMKGPLKSGSGRSRTRSVLIEVVLL